MLVLVSANPRIRSASKTPGHGGLAPQPRSRYRWRSRCGTNRLVRHGSATWLREVNSMRQPGGCCAGTCVVMQSLYPCMAWWILISTVFAGRYMPTLIRATDSRRQQADTLYLRCRAGIWPEYYSVGSLGPVCFSLQYVARFRDTAVVLLHGRAKSHRVT